MEIVPSDLSSGGSLGSDWVSNLESELELKLYGPKPKTGSQTFPANYLSRVRSGRRCKIFLISFLMVPIYSIDSSRGLSLRGCLSREW